MDRFKPDDIDYIETISPMKAIGIWLISIKNSIIDFSVRFTKKTYRISTQSFSWCCRNLFRCLISPFQFVYFVCATWAYKNLFKTTEQKECQFLATRFNNEAGIAFFRFVIFVTISFLAAGISYSYISAVTRNKIQAEHREYLLEKKQYCNDFSFHGHTRNFCMDNYGSLTLGSGFVDTKEKMNELAQQYLENNVSIKR